MKNFNFLLTLALLLTTAPTLLCQDVFNNKTLNFYKPGKIKVIQYSIGDDFTFQLNGEDFFYTLPIADLKGDSVIFSNGVVRLNQIKAVKCDLPAQDFLRGVSKSFYIFAGSWLVFTGVDVLYGGNELTWTAAVVSGSAAALGLLTGYLGKPKRYDINDDQYLRILEP